MSVVQPKEIFLKDYEEPNFWIKKTDLEFDLYSDYAIVRSTLAIQKNDKASVSTSLRLNGQDMELLTLELNGRVLDSSEYILDDVSLTLNDLKEDNVLVCSNKIKPNENTSLEGLYQSQSMFCTQCEAEGFRKITYYLDRPDVMSEFTTKITAEKDKYPVLLSNGNLIDSGELENGRHWVKWHDPFIKPAYLFALVAGDLVNVDGTFTTASGRDVLLRIFVEDKDKDKCDHAMTSLKNAMKWDEDVYGLEYDLDIFMIVAVDDFNMGAMENKGLNIFNTSCVLAKPETTTDAGFQRVEAVVAHEYFHNWSGNRVTCRDWFQLSLKEGFTVFRDAEFSADMNSRTVKRIEDVGIMRSMQFAEDAGPMAHPVQPASFIEISNFYTMTVYEKGCEVVRMIRTLIGEKQFRQGSDLYFERHDGQAVTIQDFVKAMSDVSGKSFDQFMRWYDQAGTPEVKVKTQYNAVAETFTLQLSQSCPPTPESKTKQPYLIPVELGLLGEAGALPLFLDGISDPETADNTTMVVEFTQEKQSFTFEKVKEKPVPSLFRGFSAPVKIVTPYSTEELLRIMRVDSDGFCRWDASQQLAINEIQRVIAQLVNEPAPNVNEQLINAYRALLNDHSLDPAMVSLMLHLPSESYLGDLSRVVDVDSIHHGRNRVERKIAQALSEEFLQTYKRLKTTDNYVPDAQSIARRSLKNTCLHYLMLQAKEESIALCLDQVSNSDNMTDELSAFVAIVHSAKKSVLPHRSDVIEAFYQKWKDEALVINQWFSVQASSPALDALQQVEVLMKHPAFDYKNPNKLRSLIGSFAMRNPVNFHENSGKGYTFLADQIIVLNKQNPQVASRMLKPLCAWKRYDENRQQLMKKQLERIAQTDGLSPDVFEVVSKSLI